MLFIEQGVMTEMIANAEATAEESCGFLFGHGEEPRRVTKLGMVRNASRGDKRTSFEILSRDYMGAEEMAEREKLSLMGIYHSHPNHPAVPSNFDKVASQPNFSYLIISLSNQKYSELRAWHQSDLFQLKEEKIYIIKTPC